MEKKILYFLLATSATVNGVQATYGDDVVAQQITGHATTFEYESIIRDLPPVITGFLRSSIAGEPCGKLNARYGGGTCNPTKIDFDAIYERKRGVTNLVVRFPTFDMQIPQRPAPPGHADWLAARLNAMVCPDIKQSFGDNACDGDDSEYTARFIRTGGETRALITTRLRGFFTTSSVPADPNPPEGDI